MGKVLDIHGRPVINKHQAITRAMHDEGLDEFDMEELSLLQDACGDDWDGEWDPYPYMDDYDDWDESCARCKRVICVCPQPNQCPVCFNRDRNVCGCSDLSCYDDEYRDSDYYDRFDQCPVGANCPVCGTSQA